MNSCTASMRTISDHSESWNWQDASGFTVWWQQGKFPFQQLQPYRQKNTPTMMLTPNSDLFSEPSLSIINFSILLFATTLSSLLLRAGPSFIDALQSLWDTFPHRVALLPLVLGFHVSPYLVVPLVVEAPPDTALKKLFPVSSRPMSRVNFKNQDLSDKELKNRHSEFLHIFLVRSQLIISSTSSLGLSFISLSSWPTQLLLCYIVFLKLPKWFWCATSYGNHWYRF